MNNSTSAVRAAFLDFFAKHGHEVLPSAPLIPKDDPTLMFVAAGMVPFKNIFTGAEKTAIKRAATSQKCVRAGGKHNDLDNVGYTARHHTFFEMLGNFSFGDYFKEQAIELAWELITKTYGVDAGRLCVTVYHDDDVAWNIWKKLTGFPDHKIIRIATSDNFWAMGDTGPCGPCSEIFYDHGEHVAGGPPGSPEADGDRFVEIWNLVFMQFDQQADGTRKNLPKPSIDTGMGLERISAVLQGVHDNYDIDLFKALINASRLRSGNEKGNDVAHRVIADHLRASCFLIADGVTPSNEGRGYVLRRIMRRAMRYAHQIGSRGQLMHMLVEPLVQLMGDAYPELKRAQATITETLRAEDERFQQTLGRGLKLLEEESAHLSKGGTLPGEVAFKLYDTYGFPLDLTQDILRGRGMNVDLAAFDASMDQQRERARDAWSGSGDKAVGNVWFALKEKIGAIPFVGYEKDATDATVRALLKNGEEAARGEAGDEVFVVLDHTPFYGESGGQVGDSGELRGIGAVLDTQKPLEDFFVHKVKLSAPLAVGDKVKAVIDTKRRDAIRANHSATHLLHKALRDQLGDHVTQKGSLVAPDRLRFDYSHGKALTPQEMAAVEAEVNAIIWRNTPVECKLMKPEEAIKAGAMALFGEKYGSEVRVLSMGLRDDTHYSTELCGGTHVHATGDIGLFKILSDSAVAAGIRRIEAVTRAGAFAYLSQQESLLHSLAGSLKATPDAVAERVTKLQDENKKLSRELAEAKKQAALGGGGSAEVMAETIGSIRFIGKTFEGLDPKELRGIAEGYRKQADVVAIGTNMDGKASVVVAVGDAAKAHSAVSFVQAAVNILGGKGGGGRPEMAQGGGPDAEKLPEAIAAVRGML